MKEDDDYAEVLFQIYKLKQMPVIGARRRSPLRTMTRLATSTECGNSSKYASGQSSNTIIIIIIIIAINSLTETAVRMLNPPPFYNKSCPECRRSSKQCQICDADQPSTSFYCDLQNYRRKEAVYLKTC